MEVGELNLVPYMDIMVNLIMFILLSMTSFIQMKIINVSVPAIGDDTMEAADKDDEKTLAIVVGIVDKKGFIISVDGNFMEGTPPNEPTIPNLADGKYDFAMLTTKMAKVKSMDSKQTALTIVPDKRIDYSTLVKTMDAIRRDVGGQVLFPDVLLGVQ